jgi:hypothetical protein
MWLRYANSRGAAVPGVNTMAKGPQRWVQFEDLRTTFTAINYNYKDNSCSLPHCCCP